MLNINIPDISNNSGINSDGVILGSINHSMLSSSFVSLDTSNHVYVFNKIVVNNIEFNDISDKASSGISDLFKPFGDNTDFNKDSALYIACDYDIKEIYFQITTQGDWVGDGIEIYDSTDGISENRLLGNINDSSNGFRNSAGVYKITFDTTNIKSKAFSPAPMSIPTKKWLVIKPKNFSSVITSPKLSKIWVVLNNEYKTYRNITDILNFDFESGDFSNVVSKSFDIVGTEYYYILPSLSYGIDINLFRKNGVYTESLFEYLSKDDTWKTFNSFNDSSSGFNNGPSVLGSNGDKHNIRWEIPSDWVSKTISLKIENNSTSRFTGYIVRRKITSISNYDSFNDHLVRLRCKCLGKDKSSGYIKFYSQKSFKRLSIGRIGLSSNEDVNLQLLNINNGDYRNFIIPSNTKGNISIDFTEPLIFKSGHELMLRHVNGGNLKDISLHIQE